MPEGHTLRRLADDLTDAFAGRTVGVSSPQGRFAADAALLDQSTLVSADSSGKHLFIEFEGERFVHVHLGLIGAFDVHPSVVEVEPPRGAVRLRLVAVDAQGSAYADLRGATQCELVTWARTQEIRAKLGPDPLRTDADPDRAWRRISRSPRPIGDLLMDQGVLAGVGNVYRAEVLFRHGMHPLRPGNTLRVSQWRAIWADLVDLLAQGVVCGHIDTVRPEHLPGTAGRPPRVGECSGEVYVYRRTSMPCHVCGSTIRTGELVGRNTFWCPTCQPVFRSRAVEPSTKTRDQARGRRR